MQRRFRRLQLTVCFMLAVICLAHVADAATQTLNLAPGWNWVSFYLLPSSNKVGDVLGTAGFTANDVIQTDGDSARFGGNGWIMANFSVEFGKMYQIYVDKAVTVEISGDESGQSSVPLRSGWNWIGNPTTASVSFADLSHSGGWTLNDRILTSGSMAIYAGNSWLTPNDFMLEPGKGYQIYSANEGTLTFPTAPDDTLYAVVDLSGGPNAASYPVRYSATGPNLNDDTCRTTELWLRKIPKGSFIMGSPEDELGHTDEDMTQHQVTLTQDYYIGVFECTQKQWELVMETNPSYFNNPSYYATRPVERVSYNMIRGEGEQAGAGWPSCGHAADASSFMGKLQTKTGLVFDLPTEAQWEYACRAGTTTSLNSGKNLMSGDFDDAMDEVGRYWYNGGSGYSQDCTPDNGTAKVGSYLPNAWGLYDMHGNVTEWCLDWWGASTSSTAAETDPVGPNTGSTHVVHGGCWFYNAISCSSTTRGGYYPSTDRDGLGFRVLCLPRQDLYAVVDLSGGPNASSYPVRYSATGPNLNDDTCRTTELWLRKIPAGTFTMGSPEDEEERDSKDMAQHQVTLTQDYYIGVFECTQKQWELVMGPRPSYFSNAAYYATRPVEQVSYDMIRGEGAQAGAGWPSYGHAVDEYSFMGKLQTKTGLVFDLPTEAQWEYACRAGTTTSLNSGKNLRSGGEDDAMGKVGRYWYNGGSGYSQSCTSDSGTAKVGSYLPNAWGLYDMHGNVSEWCLDWYGASTSSTAAETDPVGPNTASGRMLRGGDWDDGAAYCRSAIRNSDNPSDIDKRTGFRVLCLPRQEFYAVVDLSGGPNASSYPVRYSAIGPNLNDDTCRTTELWLRKIYAGKFTMGSPEDEIGHYSPDDEIGYYNVETQHEVTLTQDYYIGVFECTQKQWELVMGSNPSQYKGDCRPVDWVSYDMIRGTGTQAGAGWPTYGHTVDASSFMGRLQAKTGLVFDLPTEAQWEYACRAGTTTALNSGKNLSSTEQDTAMDEVGRYAYNNRDGKGGYSEHTKVGSYLRNAWGLYDMHGNVFELCLDWEWRGDPSMPRSAETDPVGLDRGSFRVGRGGSWEYSAAVECRSTSCRYFDPSSDYSGFRVLCLP